MIEYRDWAKGQLKASHTPSIYDWQNMSLAEMANRALAICKEARTARPTADQIWAFECLEAMAKALKEKYPQRY